MKTSILHLHLNPTPKTLCALSIMLFAAAVFADTVTLSNCCGKVEVSTFGAQVLSYVPTGGLDLLFMPPDRDFTRDREMHGGIPVCWPWFGRCGEPGSRLHGLARFVQWQVSERVDGADCSRLVLTLESSDATRKVWPYDFKLRYELRLAERLTLTLESENTGTKPFKVTQGFHPYFRVADPAKVVVKGLAEPLKAYPGIDGGHPKNAFGRYSFNVNDRGGSVFIEAKGETKLVVWNPGDGWDGWKPDCNIVRTDWPKFLCVEPAVLGRENAVEVPPGGRNRLTMSIWSADSRLHGRVTGAERINAKNAIGIENRSWSGTAWRNERVNMPFVVWGGEQGELTAEVGALVGPDGAAIPARVRWGGEVIVDDRPHAAKIDPVKYPPYLSGDILETSMPFKLTEAGYRALWVSVRTLAEAKPGTYRGKLTVKGGEALEFPIELRVRAETLPKERKFHLDIWQTPWTISRYYGVKPFSPEHFEKMEPYLRELADAGQKAITTTITDYPWNVRENIDSARSMVKYMKRRDGSFVADFSVMDAYVAFAEKCGIGPEIHCYAPVKFEHSHTYQYLDEATGKETSVKLLPATPEYEAYWGPLLIQLEAHAKAKGWTSRLYIALDELPGKETAATAALIAKYAPSAKFHMAGNRSPDDFKDIKIDGYSQQLGSKLMTDDFLESLAARRARGQYTTLYTCCLPFRPNALPMSPLYEQRWLGLYIAAKGFDGYLKSTFFRWTPSVDPLKDAHCYPNFPCGDAYLVYPGPRSSLRWESLVDGIEDCEKIRVLREQGKATSALEVALKRIPPAISQRNTRCVALADKDFLVVDR